jgi:hypothetical protein
MFCGSSKLLLPMAAQESKVLAACEIEGSGREYKVGGEFEI